MSSTRSISPPARATERLAGSAWLEAGLLLVGHGSSKLATATDTVEAHATRLRAMHLFGVVATAFLNGVRSPEEALRALPSGTAFVVPIFLGEGYFTKVAVPRRLGLTGSTTARDGAGGALRLCYCQPVGCNPRLAALIGSRACRAAAERGWNANRTTLLLIGHGNPHSSDSSATVRQHANQLREQGGFAEVRTAFIEEPPFIADTLVDLAECDTIVVGVLAGHGQHATDDIPGFIEAENARRQRVRLSGALAYTGIIGSGPAMAGLILDQVLAFGGPPAREAPLSDLPRHATYG